MISADLKLALLNRFPAKLVDEVLEAYQEQRRNLLLGNLRPNEVEGGRFAEGVFRLLEHFVGWPTTPLGKQIDTQGTIKKLESTGAPDGVRIHIPRTLRVIYDIRNKRDAAHLADGIDPNLQDSTFVASAIDWVLAELVRIAGGLKPEKAFELVRAITVRRVPAVEDFSGFLKTLRPSLGPPDRVLLLLYHCADRGATADHLSKWLRPSQRQNLGRTLRQLEHDKDLIVFANGQYQLTRRGVRDIENRKLLEIE